MFVRFMSCCRFEVFSAFHLVVFVYFLFYFGGFLPKFCLAGHFLFVAPFPNGPNELFLVLILCMYSSICQAWLDSLFALHSSWF